MSVAAGSGETGVAWGLRRTPLQRLPLVSAALGAEVWVKREDQSDERYGGNKARKLALLLAEARRRGVTDLVAGCPAGSNQLGALARYGPELGFACHAAIVPAFFTPNSAATLAAAAQAGVALHPARNEVGAGVVIALLRLLLAARGRRPFIIPPGATDLGGLSSRAYLAAGGEAHEQLREHGLDPRAVEHVCVLGSGGTAAGLLAAAHALGVEGGGAPRVRAVRVYPSRWLAERWVSRLARLAGAASSSSRSSMSSSLCIDDSALGRGYGWPTDEGAAATALFARDGLALDEVYMAKAAAALVRVARARAHRGPLVLWYTLPGRPPAPLTSSSSPLPPALTRLLPPRPESAATTAEARTDLRP